jgi:hypothetical protein
MGFSFDLICANSGHLFSNLVFVNFYLLPRAHDFMLALFSFALETVKLRIQTVQVCVIFTILNELFLNLKILAFTFELRLTKSCSFLIQLTIDRTPETWRQDLPGTDLKNGF